MYYSESTLTKINEFIDDYNEELNCKRLLYNPFDCLTRHHLEELHSKFIKNLLDPNETHNFKNGILLKTFLELPKINTIISNFDNFEFESLDFKKAKVTREFIIPENKESSGRIDILIEFDNLVIAIENKIYAAEQENQIIRYDSYLKSLNKNYKVIYLTLDGYESIESEGADYFCISYKKEILEWLDKCKEIAKNYKYVESGIHFYSQTIKKILNMNDKEIEIGIANIIKSDTNFLKNLNNIEKAISIVQRDFLIAIFEKLKSKLDCNFKYEYTDGKIWLQLTSNEIIEKLNFAIATDIKEKIWFGLNGTNEEIYKKAIKNKLEFDDLGSEWNIVKIKYIDFSELQNIDNFVKNIIEEIEEFKKQIKKVSQQ